MKIYKTEKASLKGVYTFTTADLVTPWHFTLNALAEDLQAQGHADQALQVIRHLNDICQTHKTIVENLIPTVARAALANWISNASPSPASIRINYSALGTGATAPANADTTLQTETYRKLVSSETNASNIAYITAFYTATETSGTYAEAGLFMNASATPNDGTLFSHVAISVTKTTSNTLTIDYTITIS